MLDVIVLNSRSLPFFYFTPPNHINLHGLTMTTGKAICLAYLKLAPSDSCMESKTGQHADPATVQDGSI